MTGRGRPWDWGRCSRLYGVLGLTSVEFFLPASLEPWLSPLIGAATGLVTAATGVYMIPSVPYLQAIGLEKDDLVQALGLSFTVSTLALAATLVQVGALQTSFAGGSLLALAPALIGMVLGQWVRARVRSETFRSASSRARCCWARTWSCVPDLGAASARDRAALGGA